MTGICNVDEILSKIFNRRGFDVHGCKMSELQRRISRRMDVLEVASLADYLEYIEANPDEYEPLFNTILMSASQFFRDIDAWNFMRESILPEILERGDEIRIWSAGCASGEEAYSVAIILAEMLGDDLSKRSIRIYATDIDEAALKFARNGTYTIEQMDGMPEDLRRKYFTRHGDACTINTDIRRMLVFSQNNLVSGPPISRIDLLLCRNVLIYLNQALQLRVIPKLHYALNDAGCLWLGEYEMLMDDAHRFKLSTPNHRIFMKTPFPRRQQLETIVSSGKHTEANLLNANKELEEVVQNLKIAFILLDRDLNVTMCNQAVKRICGLPPDEIVGKSFLDLEIAHCLIDLIDRIENVFATEEPSIVEDVECWITSDEKISLRVETIRVTSGALVFLEDMTKQHELAEELQTMNRLLDTVHGKFLSKNRELNIANRQFRRVNATLQSMNEELESTNEELSATNEELRARVEKLNARNLHHKLADD